MAILCVGQIVADIVVRPIDRYPHPGRLESVEVLELVPGGCACNTACVLAKLGARVSFSALMGTDAFGEAILGAVAETGVDISPVRKSAAARTTAVVVLVGGDGQRSFLYRPGGNELYSGDLVSDEALAACSFIHVGGAMKLIRLDIAGLLRRAKAAGCRTSLDTDWAPEGRWLEIIGPAMPHIDHLITNEEEGERISGTKGAEAIALALRAMGPPNVVVKLGERGSLLADSSGISRFPALPVNVVDTTCAGDSFVAGYLFALEKGLAPSLAMALGNAAGALCTTAVSHAGVGSLDRVVGLIRSRPDLYPDIGDVI